MDFIDRKKEQVRLHKALDDLKPKFIVVYGRRRLGKSTLIKKVLSENDIYYEAEKNEMAVQMSLLCNCIQTIYPTFNGITFDSWENLLMHFNTICEQNSTLVLDEFPYLVQKCQSFPSTLQRLIDGGNLRFNLIICGSSQRMMQKLVLDATEPLYGRADEKINLSPISLRCWQEALQIDPRQAISEYAVWGGVPRYWSLRLNFQSLDEALENLVLDEQGILFDEPASLFIDDISDIAPYASIMTVLGNGNKRFSKLSNAMGKKTTELSTPLKNLQDMHYIRKEVPFSEDEEKTKITLYNIADPFLEFYYTFIAPYKSLLSMKRTTWVREKIQKEMNNLVGGAWEELCRQSVSGNFLFGQQWGIASRWWGKVPVYEGNKKTPVGFEDIEIDVVAESIDNNYLLIGECKWNSADYADRLLKELQAKTSKLYFAKNRKVVYVLFLRETPLSSADCHILLPNNVIVNLPE